MRGLSECSSYYKQYHKRIDTSILVNMERVIRKSFTAVRRNKVIILVSFFIIVIVTIGASALTAEPLKKYTNKNAGYELLIPTQAKVAAVDMGEDITFDEHAKLNILKLPNFGLAENHLFDQSTEDLIRQNYLAAYNVPKDAFFKATVADKPALGVVFSDETKDPIVHMKQYYVLSKDSVYAVTESTPGKLHTLDRMVGSFSLTR